ncbi:unnamed protein product [Effrenium voratum]|uniref:Uncharacterized protein n=2 Tax=Effrenium voratum TaxID=2562239 RepID=A0AA36I781_9DINO|nr:unnamed protein product [Effrenium voratum]CAJ1450227.1 unnamed protein product [Effrenium voratum]
MSGRRPLICALSVLLSAGLRQNADAPSALQTSSKTAEPSFDLCEDALAKAIDFEAMSEEAEQATEIDEDACMATCTSACTNKCVYEPTMNQMQQDLQRIAGSAVSGLSFIPCNVTLKVAAAEKHFETSCLSACTTSPEVREQYISLLRDDVSSGLCADVPDEAQDECSVEMVVG